VSSWLDPVRRALDDAVEPVAVFFRDDDAGWRDDRLGALLDVFERHGAPVDVAAIPAAVGSRLAGELAARGVAVHQHGWAHVDHERTGRKCEFGPARARGAQLADIAAGAERLRDLLGPRLVPIFTPPWNRCTAATADCLVALGFACLSREWRAPPLGSIDELPIHADWLGRLPFADRLAERLREGGPAGVMLHHAQMDGDDLRRLDELLNLLARHSAVRCLSMTDARLCGSEPQSRGAVLGAPA
jgi:peptidoglycan/xylan/chitin deacetylase (PgdA/CDA1 family)